MIELTNFLYLIADQILSQFLDCFFVDISWHTCSNFYVCNSKTFYQVKEILQSLTLIFPQKMSQTASWDLTQKR